MSRIVLITGGVRSGKSAYAVKRALEAGEKRCFLATAEPFDDDMKVRIARHREERAGHFTTEEEPLHPARVLDQALGRYDVVLMDCLTVWLNNLFYHFEKQPERIAPEMEFFLKKLELTPVSIFLVTNEIGSGLIPGDPPSRKFVDALGKLNQSVARIADEVVFMVSGIPSVLKGSIYAKSQE